MVDWKVEDEGPIADLLNIEITQLKGGKVKLAQTTATSRARRHTPPDRQGAPHSPGGEDTVRRVTHDARCRRAQQHTDEVDDDDFRRRYLSLVGTLLYCSVNTRSFAVGYLCCAMSKPIPELYDNALRVLYYLERTKDLGLTYEGDDLPLYGMTDSDGAVKHSTSGRRTLLDSTPLRAV